MFQVKAEAALVATAGGERGRYLTAHEDPEEVGIRPALHLDDVGSKVGQHATALHADTAVSKVGYPETLQRPTAGAVDQSGEFEGRILKLGRVLTRVRRPEPVANPLPVKFPEPGHHGGPGSGGDVDIPEGAARGEMLVDQYVGRTQHGRRHDAAPLGLPASLHHRPVRPMFGERLIDL